jgi:hypothetical protein
MAFVILVVATVKVFHVLFISAKRRELTYQDLIPATGRGDL